MYWYVYDCVIVSFLGQRTGRGQCPVEHRGGNSVHPSVHTYVPPWLAEAAQRQDQAALRLVQAAQRLVQAGLGWLKLLRGWFRLAQAEASQRLVKAIQRLTQAI